VSGLLAERDRLRQAVVSAERDAESAEQAAKREWHVGAELLQPLWARRYDATRPTDVLVEFTDRLIAQVRERGLAFDLSTVDRSLIVVDPAARDEWDAARRALADARRALRKFETDNGEDLRLHEEAEEAQKIRDALAGNDPNAIREAIGAGR